MGGAGLEQGEQPSGDSKTDNQTLLRLLEEGDKVSGLLCRWLMNILISGLLLHLFKKKTKTEIY